MDNEFRDTAIKYTFGGRFLSAAGVFVLDSLEAIIVWIIVMFSVIICDFIAGSRKSLIMHDPFRISRALRATMGKMCTYFSFVIAAVFIEHASGITGLAKWAIVLVCGGEGLSIINNILIPKGYCIDIIKLFTIIGEKFGKVKQAGDIIKETEAKDGQKH